MKLPKILVEAHLLGGHTITIDVEASYGHGRLNIEQSYDEGFEEAEVISAVFEAISNGHSLIVWSARTDPSTNPVLIMQSAVVALRVSYVTAP